MSRVEGSARKPILMPISTFVRRYELIKSFIVKHSRLQLPEGNLTILCSYSNLGPGGKDALLGPGMTGLNHKWTRVKIMQTSAKSIHILCHVAAPSDWKISHCHAYQVCPLGYIVVCVEIRPKLIVAAIQIRGLAAGK